MMLDPFGFIPHLASRIIGLGGDDTSDQNYAFHTPYVACATGAVTFTIRLLNLHATVGNLTVRINAISTAPGSVGRTVKMTSRALSDLAETGEMQVTIEAKPHLIYAVTGLIYGVSDAHADAVQILLDNPDDGSQSGALVRAAKYTSFGRDAARDIARLVAGDAATLADPVSQFCTDAQFEEGAYIGWLSALKLDAQAHRKQWEAIYTLQVLERYGMLDQGAVGLGFGSRAEPIAAACAARGCQVTVTDYPVDRDADEAASEAGAVAPRYPAICPDDVFDAAVSFLPAGDAGVLDDLHDFDFCWSNGAVDRFDTIADGVRFIIDSLQCLKIGGVAVHTLAFHLPMDGDDRGGTFLRRSHLERLGFELVSLGHQIAQFKYDDGGVPSGVTSLGLIIRKGESNFY